GARLRDGGAVDRHTAFADQVFRLPTGIGQAHGLDGLDQRNVLTTQRESRGLGERFIGWHHKRPIVLIRFSYVPLYPPRGPKNSTTDDTDNTDKRKQDDALRGGSFRCTFLSLVFLIRVIRVIRGFC